MVNRILNWIEDLNFNCLEQQKNLENFGFISDREKLIILKQQLYRMARAGENTADLRRAIDCITEGLEAENRENNSFLNQLSGITNSLILIGLIATAGSYTLTGTTPQKY
ncbi:MAG: hypothetical protein KME22_03920 [Hassallia sp. WJT32-NPBG1]|jgi:hypothetical protein|nr:hypothetical protein [Spirirestis rafaelensis WJT71-NPBG6]MBW4606379.1 hypothetical protein [Hassallia sp. WJT32-NPBG1]